jgi:hypothetical protein
MAWTSSCWASPWRNCRDPSGAVNAPGVTTCPRLQSRSRHRKRICSRVSFAWCGRQSLIVVAVLIVFGAKAAHDWFEHHFAYGALKPEPYHASSALRDLSTDLYIARIQRREFDALPSLPASWGWALLPEPWATDALGHASYWVAARRKGTLPDKRYLPASGAHIGDHYVMDDGSNTAWIWMVAFGKTTPAWIDP